MPDVLVRDLSPEIKMQVEKRARQAGRSMSDEMKRLVMEALERSRDQQPLGQAIRSAFSESGFAELELPTRSAAPRDPFGQ